MPLHFCLFTQKPSRYVLFVTSILLAVNGFSGGKLMGSPWLSKKAFLYFGGAFILLLGGAIVLMAPYNFTLFVAHRNDAAPFDIYNSTGYYPEMEISVTVGQPANNGTVNVNIRIVNNATLEAKIVNMTLTLADKQPSGSTYQQRETLALDPGAYTVYIDAIVGATDIDISFTQLSDSRTYIVTGGAMNIVGLLMGATGYCITGSIIPTGNETIVDWGYDEAEAPGN
jgi:hypothetical protein